MELAYLWPSFTNGFSLYAELTGTQSRLSRQMIGYWGAFARTGAPEVPGQPAWPQDRGGRLMSLRPGGHSQVLGGAVFAAEHHCGFWDGAGRTALAAAQPGTAPRPVTWAPDRPAWVMLRAG